MNESHLNSDLAAGILLTKDGYTALQAELEHLTLVKRPEIADRIRESQQHGEFSEDNSELDEVKFEQAMVEGRIAELKTIFGTAAVIDAASIPTDSVGIGSKVTVTDLEFGDNFELRVVSSVEADPSRDLISNESPMGLAMLSRTPGAEFSFDTPDGTRRYRIDRIER
jgi:transcription elongation factor GreA